MARACARTHPAPALARRVYCLQRNIVGAAKVAELDPSLVQSIRALNQLDNVVYSVASDVMRAKLACFNITGDDVAKFRASTVRWRAQRATGKDACNTLTEKIPRETVGNPNWREDEWYLEKYCPLELHSLRHNVTYSEGDEIERRRQDAHKRKKREHDELIKTRAAKAEEARANSKKTTRSWRARSRAR